MSCNEELSVAIVSAHGGKSPGGVTRSFVFDEAYRLAKRGVDVHLVRFKVEEDSFSYGIHFHGLGSKIDFQAMKMSLENLPVYPPISLLRTPRIIYRENLYALNICKVIEKFDVNLIHAHFAYPEGWSSLLAKRKVKKPLVVTIHGYDINTVPEIGYGIRLNKKLDSLVRVVLKNADAVICVSSDIYRKVLKLGACERVFQVFNAVDLGTFRPPTKQDMDEIGRLKKSLGIDENDFLILNARHLRPVYGLNYLIKAAKIVCQSIKEAKFIIAGKRIDKILNIYERLLKR